MRVRLMVGKLIAMAAGIALSLSLAPAARASIILSPTGGAASSTFSADYDIGNTIDQSGLGVHFISGVTNFDTYLAGHPIHTAVALDNEWFTELGVIKASVFYDLGSVRLVDRLALWNEEVSGVGTGGILYSVDGATYLSLT